MFKIFRNTKLVGLLSTFFGVTALTGLPTSPREQAPQECGTQVCAHEHATSEQGDETRGYWGWRWVTHFGCGFTGLYYVWVGGYTRLTCAGCGCCFTAIVPCSAEGEQEEQMR